MPSLNASVVKDKVFFSERCKFDDVFAHPDVLLSHHWNNGLNYLSLEALYHNIPLVHNSEFFQEVGYFYPDFDVHKGAEALEDALTNHKANFLEHQAKNKQFLKQFSIYNTEIQKQYQNLLDKVVDKSSVQQNIFTHIYQNNKWGGKQSISGPGSDVDQTQIIIKELPILFKKYNISSILDAPCGDFFWMNNIDLKNINYLGVDIVEALIKKNNNKYQQQNIHFKLLDLLQDKIPKTDLILCRDCFIHFSFKDIFTALNNICKSQSQYLLTTIYTEKITNTDIISGDFRPINLTKPPFSLPEPIVIINEGCTELRHLQDKSLALWKIANIRNFLKI